MKVMITGAGGFIGRELVKVFERNNCDVIAVLRDEGQVAAYKNISCVLENKRELIKLLGGETIDVCIHLAWNGSSGKKRSDYQTHLANIENTLALCEALKVLRVKRFVGVGSSAENDTLQYIPQPGATPNSAAIYGVAKQTAHFMSKVLCTQLEIEHIWCQLSNVYGRGDRSENFINYACKVFLNRERATFTAGEQMYDFVYVSDVANAIFCAAMNGISNRCYYLGSGKPRRLKEYIFAIRNAVDPTYELHLGEIPYNGVSVDYQKLNDTIAYNEIGYYPKVFFEEGVFRTVSWLKSEMEMNDGKI